MEQYVLVKEIFVHYIEKNNIFIRYCQKYPKINIGAVPGGNLRFRHHFEMNSV